MHLITGKNSWHGAWGGACSSIHQNCFLWACSLLQILNRGESKPWSSLHPSHLPLCLSLPAGDKFSYRCMYSPRAGVFLPASCHNVWFHCLTEHCRYLAVEGNVWFLRGLLYSRSEAVCQLGCRLDSMLGLWCMWLDECFHSTVYCWKALASFFSFPSSLRGSQMNVHNTDVI